MPAHSIRCKSSHKSTSWIQTNLREKVAKNLIKAALTHTIFFLFRIFTKGTLNSLASSFCVIYQLSLMLKSKVSEYTRSHNWIKLEHFFLKIVLSIAECLYELKFLMIRLPFSGWLFLRELHLHDWRRFPFPHLVDQLKHYQALNLGYSWPRKIPNNHKCILQGRRWDHRSLWLNQQRELLEYSSLAQWNRKALRLRCQNHGLRE